MSPNDFVSLDKCVRNFSENRRCGRWVGQTAHLNDEDEGMSAVDDCGIVDNRWDHRLAGGGILRDAGGGVQRERPSRATISLLASGLTTPSVVNAQSRTSTARTVV